MADPITGNAPQGQAAPETTGQAPEALNELQDYQKFFEGISPLLERLDKNPQLVQAILDEKISPEFAQAAMDGKLSVTDAAAASQAVAEVKEKMGEKAFNAADPDALAKLVEEKVSALKAELNEKDEMRSFEEYTNRFIAETPDFEKYSKDIASWLDEHDVTDIRVAYYAVKGELSERDAKERANVDAAEAAKNVILNAASGGFSSTARVEDANLVDALIAPRTNPNRL